MMKKNIVVAPCGNLSKIFRDHWLDKSEIKNFDVCLLFYDEEIHNPDLYAGIEYFFHLKDFKYRMAHQLLTSLKPDFLDQYDQFYFLDDDIEIGTEDINKMFNLSKAIGLWICQASLTKDSYCSWPILKNKRDCFMRFIGQVEVMSPLFSIEALKICMPTFIENKSSWGIDCVWSKLLGYPKNKLAVIDDVQMKHIKPVGVSELYMKLQEDPHDDWRNVVQKYGAIKNLFTEYGRYMVVNEYKNQLLRSFYQNQERLSKLKQAYLDYGLSYRIKNKLGLLKNA